MTSITKATGDYSISIGYGSSSTGHNGISLGYQSNETDDKSISIGYKADAGRIPGHIWYSPTSDDNSSWSCITHNQSDVGDLSGTPIFVVTASSTNSYSIMTSPDGETWTGRNTAGDGKSWSSIIADTPTTGDLSHNLLFIAVGPTGSNTSAMTSQDGINWTLRNTTDKDWRSITSGIPTIGDLSNNTLFVAVCNSGSNRIMTSQNGYDWQTRTTDINCDWRSITSGIPVVGDSSNNTLFVAVSYDSYIMTSQNGINWDISDNPTGNSLQTTSICVGTPNIGSYANQPLFVSVGYANVNGVVMISNDGFYWISIITGDGDGHNWESVTAGMVNGVTLFTAVSSNGTGDRVMTSYDGINWVVGSNTPDNTWTSIFSGIPTTGTYTNEQLFVAVSSDGTNRVMVSNMMCKNSIAIGTDSLTGGENSIALGNASTTGKYHNSIAIGNSATVESHNSIVIGNGTQNVGIGTTTPHNKLTVSGGAIQISPDGTYYTGSTNFAIYSNNNLLNINPRNSTGEYNNIAGIKMTSQGAVSNSGEITAPSFNATSDFRLKKDINNLSNVLENVCKLQGVEFVRTDDETERKQIGFIAQNVEKIFPQLVQTDNSEEKYKSVSYANTCAILVEAIKEIRYEMNSEIKSLKDEIHSLKQQLNKI